jgi:hypothetical protein
VLTTETRKHREGNDGRGCFKLSLCFPVFLRASVTLWFIVATRGPHTLPIRNVFADPEAFATCSRRHSFPRRFVKMTRAQFRLKKP